jgi:hypothetical protein
VVRYAVFRRREESRKIARLDEVRHEGLLYMQDLGRWDKVLHAGMRLKRKCKRTDE